MENGFLSAQFTGHTSRPAADSSSFTQVCEERRKWTQNSLQGWPVMNLGSETLRQSQWALGDISNIYLEQIQSSSEKNRQGNSSD